MNKKKLPELLAPAGSREALLAAIEGGADAVYMGGTSFNARINAKNFSFDDIKECAALAHKYGVRLYQTLNIQIYDKEIDSFVRDAYRSAECGIDAFIVADMGAASLLKKYVPEMPLHASTQMSAHNKDAGYTLQKLGFERLVPARELSLTDIKTMVRENPLEVEIFVHGALCVSHSGQCLFSSLVGGRSGNRGVCAQPCRLPYTCDGKSSYPLSLKDLSLAGHVTDIIDSGVHSLKIEGRMKSPEYVFRVISVWRKLLDEGRNATYDDIKALEEAFSRGGFTDGYFTGNVTKKMLGVRSDHDKQISREIEKFDGITRKMPIDMSVKIKRGEPISLTVSGKSGVGTATGEIPMEAQNAPTSQEGVLRSVSKLGNTPYALRNIDIQLDDGLMVPVSWLNNLRRDAISYMERGVELVPHKPEGILPERITIDKPHSKNTKKLSARFLFPEQITSDCKEYFDKIYLPLNKYTSDADGFYMPPVVFDSEKDEVMSLIRMAISKGAKSVIISNIGQIGWFDGLDVEPVADYRFNIMNNIHAAQMESIGLSEYILSPELTIPQIRDISGNRGVIIYGRIPLMTLEKCVIRDNFGCERCDRNAPGCVTSICDRRGYTFPVVRELDHRNIVFNSQNTCMSDRPLELQKANIVNQHFIFTTETAKEVDEVIDAYKNHTPLAEAVRRI